MRRCDTLCISFDRYVSGVAERVAVMKDTLHRSAAARDERQYADESDERRFRSRHERLRLMERRRRDALQAGDDQAYAGLEEEFGDE
jgi:hypothetical protein